MQNLWYLVAAVCGGESEGEARLGEVSGLAFRLAYCAAVAGTGETASLLLRVFDAIVKDVSPSRVKSDIIHEVYILAVRSEAMRQDPHAT
jgi:hypothetical protein